MQRANHKEEFHTHFQKRKFMGAGASGQKKKDEVKQEISRGSELDEIKEQEKIYKQVQQQRAAQKNDMIKSQCMVEINTEPQGTPAKKQLPPLVSEEERMLQEQRKRDQENLDYFNNIPSISTKKSVKTVSYNYNDMDDDLQGFDINKMRKANFTANDQDDENNLFKKVL